MSEQLTNCLSEMDTRLPVGTSQEPSTPPVDENAQQDPHRLWVLALRASLGASARASPSASLRASLRASALTSRASLGASARVSPSASLRDSASASAWASLRSSAGTLKGRRKLSAGPAIP